MCHPIIEVVHETSPGSGGTAVFGIGKRDHQCCAIMYPSSRSVASLSVVVAIDKVLVIVISLHGVTEGTCKQLGVCHPYPLAHGHQSIEECFCICSKGGDLYFLPEVD